MIQRTFKKWFLIMDEELLILGTTFRDITVRDGLIGGREQAEMEDVSFLPVTYVARDDEERSSEIFCDAHPIKGTGSRDKIKFFDKHEWC
jgi:hypothetical protein